MPGKRPAPFKVQWEQALMRRSKLPLPGIAVLAALATYANADGGSIHPSHARLADDLGVTARTVGKWIREGLHTGWIVETRRGIGYGDVSRPSIYILKIPDAIEENQKQRSDSPADQYKKQRSGSTGEPEGNPNEASLSVWDLAEKMSAHTPEWEPSRATTGTLVQQNRQDTSDYQHNTNSSSTQIPSQMMQLPSEDANTEPEPAPDDLDIDGFRLGSFGARWDRRVQARRIAAAEGRPKRYRPRYLN